MPKGKTMESIIKQAIELRKESKYQESRALLRTLLNDDTFAAKAHLQIAWSYDNEGKEQEAIDHYLSSLSGSLSSVVFWASEYLSKSRNVFGGTNLLRANAKRISQFN